MINIKSIIIAISLIALFSLATGLYDYSRVSSFEKPIFTISQTADDGGSGSYYGLGYSVHLSGELRDGEYYLYQYVYSVFGIPIANISRP